MRKSPDDHSHRMQRALLALDGLSVGDAFGERFFSWPPEIVSQVISGREMREKWWRYTDDTEMALAITEVLQRHGRIEQDDLALRFAERYALDDRRGYGAGAHWLLTELTQGNSWQGRAALMFDGTGSLGNGGALVTLKQIAPSLAVLWRCGWGGKGFLVSGSRRGKSCSFLTITNRMFDRCVGRPGRLATRMGTNPA